MTVPPILSWPSAWWRLPLQRSAPVGQCSGEEGTRGPAGLRRVLLPVDALEPRLLARCLDGFPNERFTIYLLSTLDLGHLMGGVPETSAGNFLQRRADVIAHRRGQLECLARGLRAAGHSVEPFVELGNPEQVWRDFISARTVDLVVLQRWRPGGLRKSPGQRFAEKLTCPVLLVSA